MQQEVGLNEGNNDNDVKSYFCFSKSKQGCKERQERRTNTKRSQKMFLLLFIQQTNGLKNQKRKEQQVKKNGKEELKKS
jgi:hypothetical protein